MKNIKALEREVGIAKDRWERIGTGEACRDYLKKRERWIEAINGKSDGSWDGYGEKVGVE